MAIAEQQTSLTQSEINIKISENSGRAELQKAHQDAERVKSLAGAEAERTKRLADGESTKVKLLAEGEAHRVKLLADSEATRIRLTAEADADREARVGIGKAIAIEEQVRAYGGPQLQLTQDVLGRLASAIEHAKIPIVPTTYVDMGGSHATGGADGTGTNGGTSGGGANAFNLLMTLLATDRLQAAPAQLAEADPDQAAAVRAIKAEIRASAAAGQVEGGVDDA